MLQGLTLYAGERIFSDTKCFTLEMQTGIFFIFEILDKRRISTNGIRNGCKVTGHR